jgi:predicted Zn-dependent peptidase
LSERVIELPSGLTVAVEPMVSTRSVTIGVWLGIGARDEPDEHAGLCHFIEHLLFKGTDSRTAIEISQTVDRVGGDINAFTSKEYTAFYCRLPARYVADGIELLGDVLTRPALLEHDIESERQVILEELAMDDDSPEDVVHRAFGEAVYGAHPLGRSTAGDRNTVRDLGADVVRDFFTNHYRTGNTVVSVAGAVDVDEVVDLASEHFDRMPVGDGRVPRSAPSPEGGIATGRLHIDDETEQVHLVTGGHAIAREDPDREALDVVNHVLGGGLSSRLFDEIRERRGLAYSVFSTTAGHSDAGAWSIYAGSVPERADEVQSVITHELDRLVADGITDEELEIAQGYLAGAYELGLEDSGARMSRLGAQLVLRDALISVEEQLDRWSAVTHDDVRRVIDRVYGSGRRATVTVGPGSSST